MSDITHLHQHVTNGDIGEHLIDGQHVSTVIKNVFGGHDFYDNGHFEAQTKANVFHGHDVYRDGKLELQGMPNVHGGERSSADLQRVGVTFVAYSPLGRGFLAGRFQNEQDIPEDDCVGGIRDLKAKICSGKCGSPST
jgi:hypothetical protein